MKSIDKFVLVLVASLALLLAGCGGGSSSNEMDDMDMDMSADQMAALMSANTALDAAVAALAGEATDEEVAAAEGAVSKLQAEIAAATDVSDKSMYEDAVKRANDSIMAAKDAMMAAEDAKMKMEAEENAKEMAALGKALRAALGGTPLANLSSDEFMDGELKVTLADDDRTEVSLEAGNSAGSLSGWMGMDYALTEGKGDAQVTDMARVYTNRSEPEMIPFDASEKGGRYTLGADGATKGYVELGEANTPVTRAMADAFTHSGTQTHSKPAESDAVYFSGTYDGAPGRFRCAPGDSQTCTSENDGKGGPSMLTGGSWHFKPDAGAMVSQPDANYLYYGWWVRKDSDGEPTAASAFTGVEGSVTMSGDPATIAGSATYTGNAVGKFAMSNALDSTGDGGHFTADANLKATFGTNNSPNNGGMTGTIDNFRLNDGGEDAGWSVTLHRATWSNATGMFATPTTNVDSTDVDETKGTTWSINGNSAGRTGTWSGQMYDEMPAGADNDDGSNLPTTATGTFHSEFSNIGRMVGAFAVEKDD